MTSCFLEDERIHERLHFRSCWWITIGVLVFFGNAIILNELQYVLRDLIKRLDWIISNNSTCYIPPKNIRYWSRNAERLVIFCIPIYDMIFQSTWKFLILFDSISTKFDWNDIISYHRHRIIVNRSNHGKWFVPIYDLVKVQN